MKRIFILFVALLVIAFACPAVAADFATTAEIDQPSLNADFYKKVSRFYINVTIKNISSMSQTITIWTNPGWSWVTDSHEVVTSQEALKNFPTKRTLKPDEVYETKLEMATNPKDKKSITFRLGFLPNTDRPIMDDQNSALIWSNPITLSK